MENLSTIMEQMTPFLVKMSELLGQGAEFSWKVAIKQQYVDGVMGLIWAVIGFSTLVFLGKKFKNIMEWVSEEDERWFGIIFVILPIAIIAFILFSVGIDTAVNHLLNPEWQAIQDIAKLVKPTIQQ